jgi:Uncharacterized conserved protein
MRSGGISIAEMNRIASAERFLLKYRHMKTYALYAIAALAEIAGCYAFWAWFRLGRSVWWLAPGVLSLVVFAWMLALVPSEAAGRTFAAYGAIYIFASVLWLWAVEARVPDRWDILGAAVCLVGGAIILFGPRSA